MAAIDRREYVDGLLDHTITRQSTNVLMGQPERILTIEQGVDLVGGMLTYSRRVIVSGNRLLTPDITTQPCLGVKVGDRVTPIPYAEDVLNHPLNISIVRALESFDYIGEE